MSKAILLAAALLTLASSCRTTRDSKQSSAELSTAAATVMSSTDSLEVKTVEAKEAVDSSSVRGDERAKIEIRRDSVGRPVVIFFDRSFSYLAGSSSKTLGDYGFRRYQGKNDSAAEDRTAAIDTTEKKQKVEADPFLPLRYVATGGLLLFVLIYWVIVFVKNHLLPWIRQRRQ